MADPQSLTLLDTLEEIEQRTPDRLYFTQPVGGGQVETFTFHAALEEARRMAAHLRSLELPAGSRIALFSKNTAWWMIADVAIWMAGHVSVPLYPTLTPQTIREILEHSEASLIFVGKLDGFEAMKAGIPEGLRRIAMPLAPKMDADSWRDLVARTAPIDERARPAPGDLATIIYTSGSTGVPKGVMHSFETMLRPARGVVELLGLHSEDRVLSYLPLAHSMERTYIECTSMVAGFQVFFAESLDTFLDDLRRARPTIFLSVPRLWLKFQQGVSAKVPPAKMKRLLRIPIVRGLVRRKVLRQLGLDSVRFAGTGSAPIPADVLSWYRDLGLELLEGYGMSENSSYSHISRPGRMRVGHVGEPAPGVEQRIDPSGEVLVKSPGTMLGYYKAPELTGEMMTEDGFLRTGDRGELDGEGRLKLTGRVKELFKTSKGRYVAPAPIENKLVLHMHIEQACVTGHGMPQPYAVVLLSEHGQKALKESGSHQVVSALREHIDAVNRELDPHEALGFIAVVKDSWAIENGFLTPTLKIRRSVIEQTYGPHAETWVRRDERVVFHDHDA
jgi:long-chain acyl-CoA synthetase